MSFQCGMADWHGITETESALDSRGANEIEVNVFLCGTGSGT
jgi:hypothetical protein